MDRTQEEWNAFFGPKTEEPEPLVVTQIYWGIPAVVVLSILAGGLTLAFVWLLFKRRRQSYRVPAFSLDMQELR